MMLTGADIWNFNGWGVGLFGIWFLLAVFANERGLFKKRTLVIWDVVHIWLLALVPLMMVTGVGKVYYKICGADPAPMIILELAKCTMTGLLVVWGICATVYIINKILKIEVIHFQKKDDEENKGVL